MVVEVVVKRPEGTVTLTEQETACARVALKRWIKGNRGASKREKRAAAQALAKLAEPDDRRSKRLVDAVLEGGR